MNKNKRVDIYKDGKKFKTIGNNVSNFVWNDKWVLCLENGVVKKYDLIAGSLKGHVGESGATMMKIVGEKVVVYYQNKYNGQARFYKL